MSITTVKKIHNPRTNADDEMYLKLNYSNEKEFCVPKDENNRHYREILEWVADGNTIQEAD
tara:strand:+ start:314 stop:496 length:183 start_codon:yes stop_codon:yes gene_type:complete